jgi:hypothetical protein
LGEVVLNALAEFERERGTFGEGNLLKLRQLASGFFGWGGEGKGRGGGGAAVVGDCTRFRRGELGELR